MPFGGTSSGSSSVSSPYASTLGSMGKQEFKIAQPLLQTLGSQFLEALRTGGVNSFLPWITRALDASRRASSQGIQSLRQNLARTGLGGSSFGQSEIDQAQMQAGESANQTPAQMVMQFIQGAPGFAQGLASDATGNIAAAGNLDQTVNTTYTPSAWEQFMQGFQFGAPFAFNTGGGGGGYGGGTP